MVRAIERTASLHLGRPWTSAGFTNLDERASHPAGIHRGEPFSVFAKLARGNGGHAQFSAELRGLDLISRLSQIRTPVPVGPGLVTFDDGALLLSEALPERPPELRSREDHAAMGRALATLHMLQGGRFGLARFDGFFGPFPQVNLPVPENTWASFYAQRRVAPLLRIAVDSGHLPTGLAAGMERIIRRLTVLAGPEPTPALLHGDAQQNNFMSTDDGAAVIDVCPYFGHPEIDLALLGYFQPVPATVLDAYREVSPIAAEYEERIELWRIFAYLAVIAAEGASSPGREFLGRLASAVSRYA